MWSAGSVLVNVRGVSAKGSDERLGSASARCRNGIGFGCFCTWAASLWVAEWSFASLWAETSRAGQVPGSVVPLPQKETNASILAPSCLGPRQLIEMVLLVICVAMMIGRKCTANIVLVLPFSGVVLFFHRKLVGCAPHIGSPRSCTTALPSAGCCWAATRRQCLRRFTLLD